MCRTNISTKRECKQATREMNYLVLERKNDQVGVFCLTEEELVVVGDFSGIAM